jgi:hypothetical protein
MRLKVRQRKKPLKRNKAAASYMKDNGKPAACAVAGFALKQFARV